MHSAIGGVSRSVPDVDQPQLDRIDALLKGGDARVELAGVRRHALARAVDANPAGLGFVQGEVEVLDRAAFAPDARVWNTIRWTTS